MTQDDHDISASQYWGADGLVQTNRCLACHCSNLRREHEHLEDLLGQLPGKWQFLRCAGCDSLTLDPYPRPEVIARAYPPDYVTHSAGEESSDRDNGQGLIWAACNGYLNRRFGSRRRPSSRMLGALIPLFPPVRMQLDYFNRHLPKDCGTLLDVGCGNAEFLVRARDAGWRVRGIEPDPAAVSAAQKNGVDVSHTTIMKFTADGEFDHITLSHVLEHLHDPSESLQRIFTWLKPGGRIWLALPNPGGLGHRIFGRNWYSLDPPRHLFLPHQSHLIQMLQDAGYKNIRILRRGRGSRNSILPSIRYSQIRTGTTPLGSTLLSTLVDIVSSLFPRYAEETVIIGYRLE